jgi:2-methylcitrate dehydratase PrpD
MTMLIDQLTDHVLNTRYDDFSDEVIEAGKKRIIDAISCTIGGANGSGNKALLDLIRKWGGSKEATIIAHGDKVPLPNAAMMNSIMTRSFDFEVTGPKGLTRARWWATWRARQNRRLSPFQNIPEHPARR